MRLFLFFCLFLFGFPAEGKNRRIANNKGPARVINFHCYDEDEERPNVLGLATLTTNDSRAFGATIYVRSESGLTLRKLSGTYAVVPEGLVLLAIGQPPSREAPTLNLHPADKTNLTGLPRAQQCALTGDIEGENQ